MKESVGVARSLFALQQPSLESAKRFFQTQTFTFMFHLGPFQKMRSSAGVTMLTAIVSLLTDIKVDSTLAMTGEATLRGAILPVGGIKEKVLAAHRAGIKKVILLKRTGKICRTFLRRFSRAGDPFLWTDERCAENCAG